MRQSLTGTSSSSLGRGHRKGSLSHLGTRTMPQQNRNGQRGFSLTELLIVVAIMLVVAAFEIPVAISSIRTGKVRGAAKDYCIRPRYPGIREGTAILLVAVSTKRVHLLTQWCHCLRRSFRGLRLRLPAPPIWRARSARGVWRASYTTPVPHLDQRGSPAPQSGGPATQAAESPPMKPFFNPPLHRSG